MKKNITKKLTIRLFTDSKCFGPGIAQLLERVEEYHSLRAAAQSMSMAYSKAWTMVRACEAALDCRLLINTTGGRNGGGAVLTESAVRMLRAYRTYCAAVEQYADDVFGQYFDMAREEPDD